VENSKLEVLVKHMPFAENALRRMAEKVTVGGPVWYALYAQNDGVYGVEQMLGTKFENNRLVTSYGYVPKEIRAAESVAVPMVKEAWPTNNPIQLAAARRKADGAVEIKRLWFPVLVLPELPEPHPTEEQMRKVDALWSPHQQMVYREAKEEFLAANDGEPVVATEDYGTCPKCFGTGDYVDSKGKYHGPCYKCKGKGQMDGLDVVRDTVYWKYHEEDISMNGNHTHGIDF
jgi:hypothetical protein